MAGIPEVNALEDARRVSNRLGYAERMAAEEARLAAEFAAAVIAGNVDVCIHGRMAGDRMNGVYVRNARPQKLFETMAETIDGSHMLPHTAMRALALLARKGEIEAVEAMIEIAAEYGRQNAEVDE